ITITGQNDAPVAANVSGAVLANGPATTVMASYTDPDVGDTHTFTINTLADATKGKVTNSGGGTFTYDPNGAFASLLVGQTATDRFLYTVTDGSGAASTATVTISVTGQKVINHPPVIAAADKVETALITESRYDPIVQTVYGAIRFTDADPADRPTASIVSETILDLDEHGRPHPLNDPVLSALKAGFTIAPERGNTNNGAI